MTPEKPLAEELRGALASGASVLEVAEQVHGRAVALREMGLAADLDGHTADDLDGLAGALADDVASASRALVGELKQAAEDTRHG